MQYKRLIISLMVAVFLSVAPMGLEHGLVEMGWEPDVAERVSVAFEVLIEVFGRERIVEWLEERLTKKENSDRQAQNTNDKK